MNKSTVCRSRYKGSEMRITLVLSTRNFLYTWTQQTHICFHLFDLVNVHRFNDVRQKNKFSCSACVRTKKSFVSSLLCCVLSIKFIHLHSILC
jgi:hypothetical protein